MKKILLIFILLIMAGWFGTYLNIDSGYVLITYNHWSIEMTLLVAILVVLSIYFIMHLFFTSIHWIKSMPQKIHAMWRKHQAKQEQKRLENIAHDESIRQTYFTILDSLILKEADLDDFVSSLPRSLRQDVTMIMRITQYWIKQRNYNSAEKMLYKALKHDFNINLVDLYSQIPINPAKLQFIEHLVKDHPHDAKMYLYLARLNFSAQLWGQTQHYIHKSLEISPSPEAYYLLARLLEQLDDLPGACKAYKKSGECR